eukprot:scaffold21888_cov177-Skeletonema_marinoi.AAC.3
MSVLAIQEGSQSSKMLVLTNLLEWRNVGKDSKVHEARMGGRPWLIQYWVLAGGGLDGLEEVEDEAMSFIDSGISGGVITNHFKFHYALQMVGVVKGVLG